MQARGAMSCVRRAGERAACVRAYMRTQLACGRVRACAHTHPSSLRADQMLRQRKAASVRQPPAVEPWRPRSASGARDRETAARAQSLPSGLAQSPARASPPLFSPPVYLTPSLAACRRVALWQGGRLLLRLAAGAATQIFSQGRALSLRRPRVLPSPRGLHVAPFRPLSTRVARVSRELHARTGQHLNVRTLCGERRDVFQKNCFP